MGIHRLVSTFGSLVLLAATTLAQAASLQTITLDSDGTSREFILASANPSRPGALPLVILLHGHIGTAANALGKGRMPSPLSAWLDIVDREPVLVAALQGLKGADDQTGWHDCRLDSPGNPQVDDVAFAGRVVQQLVAQGRADPKRVFVMGMSNGGMMAYRLALQMQPVPLAIAAVSSSMATSSACTNPPPKVSVLLINGTADPIVPYAGGDVGTHGRSTGRVIGAEASRDFWLHADGLASSAAVTTAVPHLNASDPTRAIKTTYGPNAGPQVEMVSIQNGGHVEPSLRFHYGFLYSRLVGMQNQDLESAEEAWAFFKDKATRP
jgi:polyhydroxybutyrate depolymerase